MVALRAPHHLLLPCSCAALPGSWQLVIDVEEDVEKADRKKGEIGQKSAVFMILRRFATGKS